MGDLTMRYLMQHQFPNHQIGKVYSLRWTINNLGIALGLLLSGSLFQAFGTRGGISFFALGLVTCGLLGMVRFFKEELDEPRAEQQTAQISSAKLNRETVKRSMSDSPVDN
jgi:MFS family permease